MYIQGLPLDSKESACKAGDLGFIPRLGRSFGVGDVYPLQYFCLENSMGREAWWATVHGVAKSLNTYQGDKSSRQEDLHLDRKCSVNTHSFYYTLDSVGPASQTAHH